VSEAKYGAAGVVMAKAVFAVVKLSGKTDEAYYYERVP